MVETGKPVFFVDAHADPVVMRIEGRASFQNSGCLRDFVTEMLAQGKTRLVIDFQHCTSMDSTFLGILAGVALQLRKGNAGGAAAGGAGGQGGERGVTGALRGGKSESSQPLILARVGQRNLELIRNLGIHRLMTVDSGDFKMNFDHCARPLTQQEQDELSNARMALEAHENLVAADESNRSKFQDVLSFLKNRVDAR
ncbi:anti-anti-sigma factor [Cephaloticoccus capnophilus]|uniref:Anti-anti-sigma factor n=1 Tax=Cephaloticoccus capnophilus TaxID=1548208 RepID=A0A139SR16_9BACT|nr:STAS domain-containing protein [Cephaloticoccus capnophilus]KXU36920.1 anti-anti-sigma factor [Cephaloticoccus capnophilus]